MKWAYSDSLGVPELDERLSRAFERLAGIKEIREKGGSWSEVHAEIGALNAELAFCFAVEEALLRIHDCPDGERHREEHAELLQDMRALERATLTNGLTDKMIGTAYAAAVGHHLTQDRRHARYLPGVKASEHR